MHHRTAMRFPFLALLAVALLPACDVQPTQESRAAAFAADYVRESGLPGVAVSVGRQGEIVWSQGFGLADLEQQVPVEPAVTRFRVGSLAKPFTAAAVGLLVEAGKLNLDAPIQTYLPDYPVLEAPITARQLGGHLAGIRHYEGDEFFSARAYNSVQEGLAIFQDDPLVAMPDTRFSYSTYGYNLLSAVVEAAAQQDFVAFMQEHVFAATGMASTTADHVYPIISHRSRYYEVEDGEVTNSRWVDNSNKWAGGGFLSTSEDLVRFGFAHLTDTYLQPETIALLWAPQQTNTGEDTGYGIGWGTREDEQGRQYIGHTGGSVGGTTNFRVYPEQGLVIAVITNTSGGSIAALTEGIVEAFLGETT